MTKQEKIKIIILIVFLMLVCLVLIQIYKTPINQEILPNSPISTEKTDQVATLEINDLKYESEIIDQTTIYDFMHQLKTEGKISFEEKTYTGMGKFINKINNIKNEEKNWVYYVNGKKANIGISNYKINPGDVVSWKYEDSY